MDTIFEDYETRVLSGWIEVGTDTMDRNPDPVSLRSAMITFGYLPTPGHCGCSICNADGDCCGRFVPMQVSINEIDRKQYKVNATIKYSRNI